MLDYIRGDTLVHRLDVRVKAVIFLLLTLVAFMYKHPVYNIGFALLVTLIYFYLRVPFHHVWTILKPLLPLFTLIVILSGFTYPPDFFVSPWAKQALFYGWFDSQLPFLYGGFYYGMTLMLRIYAMVLLTAILIMSTPLGDFIELMHAMRLPQPLTFIVVTGLRFIPTMQRKVEQVFDAQRARGAPLSGNGMFSRIVAFVPIMVPLIVDSIRMSEKLAISMLNRGYGASKQRTRLNSLSMQRRDYVFLIVSIGVIGCFVYIRMKGYGTI